jgi:predicted ATP-dependent serine protease
MTSNGLIDVANPSGTFLSRSLVSTDQEGSAVAVVMEGSRLVTSVWMLRETMLLLTKRCFIVGPS